MPKLYYIPKEGLINLKKKIQGNLVIKQLCSITGTFWIERVTLMAFTLLYDIFFKLSYNLGLNTIFSGV